MGSLVLNYPGYFNEFNFRITHGPVNYLGINFTHHAEDFFKLNYLPKLSRIKNLIHQWSKRDLTPIGKIIIIKTFAVSQLVYILTVLPSPPVNFLQEINRLFHKFIWDNKPDKIRRSVLLNNKQDGGLRMIDVALFATSLKTSWVKMYLDDNHRPWKDLFDYCLKAHGCRFLFNCNFQNTDVNDISNVFVKEVCQAWAHYNYNIPVGNYGNQIILNNSFIKIDKQIIYNERLFRAGAYYVSNFFNEDGTILQYRDFMEKHDIEHFSYLNYFSIVSAIPRYWRNNLGDDANLNINCQRMTKFIFAPKSNRCVYENLVKDKVTTPRAKLKWEEKYRTVDWNWQRIFSLIYTAVRDPKIRYFQFRFLHRILGVNQYMHRIGIANTPTCSFCNNFDETLEHLFWFCNYVDSFWKEVVRKWWKCSFELSPYIISFGCINDELNPINFLIFNAKYYIFFCKVQNKIPTAEEFSVKFRFQLSVEKFLLQKEKKEHILIKFDNCFENV